MCVLEVTYGNG